MIKAYYILPEQAEDLQDQTDKILATVTEKWLKMVRLQQRHEELTLAARGVSGIRYDKDRVQTSHKSGDDVLVRMLEVEEELRTAQQEYYKACEFLNNVFTKAGLTTEEYQIMYLRHLSHKTYSFQTIAEKIGGMNRKRSFYLYTKAYCKVEQTLQNEGHVVLHQPSELPRYKKNTKQSATQPLPLIEQ